MVRSEFEALLQKLQERETELNKTKGVEYAHAQDDALANFKRIAEKLGIDPLIVAYIYFNKHIDAIEYAIKNGKVLSESIGDRVADARLYLALLFALMRERDMVGETDK